MTNYTDIQVAFLNAIENEMALVIDLRRKYGIGFSIYAHMYELLKQERDIRDKNYWLERKNVSDTCEMLTAYFNDGSTMTCRRRIEIETQPQAKEVI